MKPLIQVNDLVREMTDEEYAQWLIDTDGPEARVRSAKASRQAAVDSITVTVDDMVFDGDETSQTRMARALVVMQAASIPTISWVLHDNTVATVTVTQLTQALAAAGAEQARLWVLPYEAVPA